MTDTAERQTVEALAAQWDEEPGNEPWEPPGMWRPKVGDRVRIRLSGECSYIGEPGSEAARRGSGHPSWMDGKTGEVVEILCDGGSVAAGHPYLVDWDEPQDVGGRMFAGSSYAAAELIPLDPADDEREGAD